MTTPLEYETTQRLVGALVSAYGYPLDDDTEKMAATLATVALAGVEQRHDGDRDVAYVECLPAQEAAYWESRRLGWGLTDKQIGHLLRIVAPHLRGET